MRFNLKLVMINLPCQGDYIAANNIEFCNLVFVLDGEVEFSSTGVIFCVRGSNRMTSFSPHAIGYMEPLWLIQVSCCLLGNRVELSGDNCTLYSCVKEL